jgi:hypothetical protein
MENPSTIAFSGKTVVYAICAVTKTATVSAPFAIAIAVHRSVMSIAKKYARDCQSLPMFAMAVNYEDPVE